MEKSKEEIPTFLLVILSVCIVFVVIVAIGIAVFVNRDPEIK